MTGIGFLVWGRRSPAPARGGGPRVCRHSLEGQGGAGERDDSAEARISLIVAGSDAAEFFEALEEVLDQVPPFIHLTVVEDRRLSICLGGDDGDGAPVAQDGPQGVAVEGLV